jgi:hypothetical protein
MTKLLSTIGVALAFATVSLLAGCQLYFGSSSSGGGGDDVAVGSGSGGSGSAGSGTGSGSAGNPPGFQCNADAQCAAGCFCASGICTEGGFCGTDKDCGTGFHCDTNRASCIPNPQCSANEQCKPGSACDTASGGCVATCACTTDADAVKQGFGWCDEARSTCMKGTDPAGTCLGAVTCTATAPVCPENQVPLRKDGCFTGKCRAIAACEAAPECTALQHQDDCDARTTDCTSLFLGHNCTGTTCGKSDVDCHCESYSFQSCGAKGTPVTIIPDN